MRVAAFALVFAGCATAGTAVAPGEEKDYAIWSRTEPPPPAPKGSAPALPAPITSKLPGGTKVTIVESRSRPIVSIRLLFPNAITTAPAGREGSTFLATALLLMGSPTDAKGVKFQSGKTLQQQITGRGGHLSFEVTHDGVWFGIDGYARDVNAYLELLLSAVIRPAFERDNFVGYRQLLLDRLEELELGDQATFTEVLAQASFGAGHVYAQSILGNKRSLKALEAEHVSAEQRRVFAPDGATLVVVGDVSAAQVLAAVRQLSATWMSALSTPARAVTPARIEARKSVRLVPRPNTGTTQLCATRSLADGPDDPAAADALALVLGYSANSRLFRVLREQQGMSYSPWATVVHRKYGRSLVACATVDAARAATGLTAFVQALEALRTGPTEAELVRARAVLLARERVARRDVHATATSILEDVMIGERSDHLQQIEELTVERVRALSEKVLDPSTIQLLVAGRIEASRAAVAAANMGPTVTVRFAELGDGSGGGDAGGPARGVAIAVEDAASAFESREVSACRLRVRVAGKSGDQVTARTYELIKLDGGKRERAAIDLGTPSVVGRREGDFVVELEFNDGWPYAVVPKARYVVRVDGKDSAPFTFRKE